MEIMHAHHQWATRPTDQRYGSIEELETAVLSRRNISKSTNTTLRAIVAKEVEIDGKTTVTMNGQMDPAETNHWSFGQICSWAKAPAHYLRQLPTELVVKNLNHSLQRNGDQAVKLMTHVDPEGQLNRLGAVTGVSYGRIWDADVVAGVRKLNERTGNKFRNPVAYKDGKWGAPLVPSGLYASDHDCFIFMIDGGDRLDISPRAQLHKGFIVRNSEVGGGAFNWQSFLFNAVCGNNIIWGATELTSVNIIHNSRAPERFVRDATPQLLDFIGNSTKAQETTVLRAHQTPLLKHLNTEHKIGSEHFNKMFAKRYDTTLGDVKSAIDAATREEGQCETVWDMVQGLTAHARGFEWIDARIDLEAKAGKLLEELTNN